PANTRSSPTSPPRQPAIPVRSRSLSDARACAHRHLGISFGLFPRTRRHRYNDERPSPGVAPPKPRLRHDGRLDAIGVIPGRMALPIGHSPIDSSDWKAFMPHPVDATDPGRLSENDVAAIDHLRDAYARLRKELGRVIVGQQDVIERLAICLFARGHALLMGVPGLAKTLMVNKVAETMSLKFSRIQFTPDLMPM